MDRDQRQNETNSGFTFFKINLATFSNMLVSNTTNNGGIDLSLITNSDNDNNTVHQQSNQAVQPAGQSFQYIQHPQAPVNYIRQEPTNLQQHMTSPILTSIALRAQRPIIIDGLNIGYAHGCHQKFSAKGISLCIQYFVKQGFQCVKTFLPHHYSNLSVLANNNYVYFTPSRKINNVRLTCYSDRIMLDHAYNCGGVVVSNDNFRDLYAENEKYREVIENRHIMIMFIEDEIIVPIDQYSHRYPNLYLSNILHFPA